MASNSPKQTPDELKQELDKREAYMIVLCDAHADIEQNIERFNSQRENITHDIAQVVALEAELERVRQDIEERAYNLSKDLFTIFFPFWM